MKFYMASYKHSNVHNLWKFLFAYPLHYDFVFIILDLLFSVLRLGVKHF